MVEKGLHELEHKDDIHCTATDKHFHNLEHTCSICEFTTIDLTYPVAQNFVLIIPSQQFLFQPFVEGSNETNAFQHLPARAPPIA